MTRLGIPNSTKRQLVKAGLAQEAAHAGDARIVAQLVLPLPLGPQVDIVLQQLGEHLLGVGTHRAKLLAAEVVAIGPQAHLLVQHRPWRIELDQGGYEEQKRAYEQPACYGPQQVQGSLGPLGPRIQQVVLDLQPKGA
jgi:hypothetical protein